MHRPPHACTCPLHPFSYARNRSSTSFPILNIFNPFLNCNEFHNKCKKSKPTLSSHSSIACMHCSIPHVSGSRSVVPCLVRVQRKRLLLQLIQRMSLRCVAYTCPWQHLRGSRQDRPLSSCPMRLLVHIHQLV